ncbi:MAG TPA: hypothetical protein VGS12_13930 [Caulobacteraceae bacterium]|nr:hypothetical protein [Caulobacteraceae bacterium]
MTKIYAAARALAVLVAIAAAFATIPSVAVILLVLGGIAGIGNTAEDNMRVFLVAIVLMVGAASLKAIPSVGDYLTTIFTGIGTAAFGASVVGVCMGLWRRTMADWSGSAPA